MSIASRLKMALDVILGKEDPLRSGCAYMNGEYRSATKGVITKAEYDEWCQAMDIIRAQRKLFISGKIVYKKGELDDYRKALLIENKHASR